MKTKNKICATILLILNVFMISCNNKSVQFQNPLPPDEENLTFFDKKLTGEYWAESSQFNYLSSKKISISDSVITLQEHYVHKIAKIDFDTVQNVYILNNAIFEISGTDTIKYFFNQIGDTLHIPLDYIDTLFSFSHGDVLRNAGKYFYINIKSENSWEVYRIRQKGDKKITLYSPNNEKDIDLLNKITGKIPVDSVQTIYNLSKKQFNSFRRKGGFSVSDDFNKM